jgi:ferritin-like metal-binding protein YciE
MTLLRQVGHFEKSCYEIVRSFADVLEESDVLKAIDEMLSQTEENERTLILLTEDMMDSLTQDRSTQDFGVFRVVPRNMPS